MSRRTEKYTPRYTYSEWLHWEERGELIHGEPIPKASRIGPKHEKAVAAFKTAFSAAITENGCKDCSVGEPIDYKIANHTILRPDVYVVCGKINKTYLDYPATVVVEVISKVSEERDRSVKMQSYEKHGVKYYLIADAMKKTVEIFELIEGKYELKNVEGRFEFELSNNCKISVDLETIF